MKVSVTFKNVSENEALSKGYIEEKLSKIKKYFDKPIDVQVVISMEKFRYEAEINITAAKLPAFAAEEAKNFRLAFDGAADKLEKQIKKQLEKKRESKESIKSIEGSAVMDAIDAE